MLHSLRRKVRECLKNDLVFDFEEREGAMKS